MTVVTPQGKPSEPPVRPRWPIVAAVSVAGAILGYLFGAAGSTGDPVAGAEATTTSTIDGPTTTAADVPDTPPSAPPDQPLQERVPGLVGTLFVQSGNTDLFDSNGPRLTSWPPYRTSPFDDDLPISEIASPDAGHNFLAGLGAAVQGKVLYLGPARSMRPAMLDVISYAWHATEPGQLAWLTLTDEPGHYDLMVAEVAQQGAGPLRISAGSRITTIVDARLITWGQWGFLVGIHFDPGLGEEAEVILLDPLGAERWRHRAGDVRVADTGDILLIGSYREVSDFTDLSIIPASSVESGTRVRLDWIPARTVAAAWSPDGGRLALVVHTEDSRCCDALQLDIQIWGIDSTLFGTSDLITDFSVAHVWPYRIRRGFDTPRFRTSEMRWTLDGRFVIVPGSDVGGGGRLVFYDTVDLVVHEIEFPHTVHRAFVRQIAFP